MNLAKYILEEAVKVVAKEGLSGDEAVERTNEIYADASLEKPKTEVGKAVRKAAEGVKTPYVKYDYNALRDKTTFVAVQKALPIIAKYENLVYPMNATTEDKERINKDYDTCSLELFNLLNEYNVGIDEYKVFFGSLEAIMKSFSSYMMQQVDGHRSEILSRALGAKNPGTGKFDASYATYKHLTDLLEKSRKDTGGKLEDYFNLE